MNKKERAQMIKALNEERNTECFWCDIWGKHETCAACCALAEVKE